MYYCITVLLTCIIYVLLYYCIIDLLSVTVYVCIYKESFVISCTVILEISSGVKIF